MGAWSSGLGHSPVPPSIVHGMASKVQLRGHVGGGARCCARSTPPTLAALLLLTALVSGAAMVRARLCARARTTAMPRGADQTLQIYLALFVVAPVPRAPRPSEKRFRTVVPGGAVKEGVQLSCWQDRYDAVREAARRRGDFVAQGVSTSSRPRWPCRSWCRRTTRRSGWARCSTRPWATCDGNTGPERGSAKKAGPRAKARGMATRPASAAKGVPGDGVGGWEILVVSDGSTDATVETALDFARRHDVSWDPSAPGPEESIRVVCLEDNRGKGGAVVHGLRHVRGEHAVFADADGASRFTDPGRAGPGVARRAGRRGPRGGGGIARASGGQRGGGAGEWRARRLRATSSGPWLTRRARARLQRSFLRNLLMHSFHLFLRLLTPPATAAIKDTQCGFKLFSRAALPHIVPYMHSEGLDLRRRDAHAGRVGRHPRRRGGRRLEGGQGEQAERVVGQPGHGVGAGGAEGGVGPGRVPAELRILVRTALQRSQAELRSEWLRRRIGRILLAAFVERHRR